MSVKMSVSKHPDALWGKYKLAKTLYDQEKYDDAEDLFRQTVRRREKTLGRDHSDTLWSKYWTAKTLQHLGRHNEAEKFFREVVRGRENTLRAEHPDTLWSKYWLATTLYDQEKYDDAEDLFRQTVRGREKTLGRDHSDTLLSKQWLETLKQRKDKTAESWPRVESAESSSTSPGPGTRDTESFDCPTPLSVSDTETAETSVWHEVAFDSATLMTVSDMQTARMEADNWFTNRACMPMVDRFFSLFRRTPISTQEMVKIELIDSGIDLSHPIFKQLDPEDHQISNAFCHDFIEGVSPVTDSTGHGTHCAHAVLKVCKTARLYIAKVFESDYGDQGTVDRIVQAIEWGEKMGVDIICMAFAFSDTHQAISRAIREARGKRNVLVFAAASNDKHYAYDPVGFPANSDEVIRVNSCTYNGKQSNFSPSGGEKKDDNLSTIGEEVSAAFPKAKNDGIPEKRMSGTSVATAILTGIAGLVIEFSRLESAPQINTPRTGPLAQNLLTNDGMKAVLLRYMSGKKPPAPPAYSYIRPWLLFTTKIGRGTVVHRIREALQTGV